MNRMSHRVRLAATAVVMTTRLIALPARADLTDGLVAYWSFDEDSGTVAHDGTTHGHHAQIYGTEWDTGISGACLLFDGLDDYVILDPFTGCPSAAMTAVLWMRTSDSARHGTPFSYAVEDCDNEYLIYDYQHLWVWIQCVKCEAGVAVNDGVWHQIALAWSSDSEQAVLYVDGNPVHTAALGSGQHLETDGVLVFGQDQDTPGGGFVAGQAFQGQLDEIRIYDRALSQDEVQQLMWDANPEITEQYLSGDQTEVSGSDADPVNTATGNFYHQVTDLAAPTRGGMMVFTRYYNSAAATPGRRDGGTQGKQPVQRASGPLREDAAQPDQCNSDDLTVRAAALAVVVATLPALGLACWFLQHKSRRPTRASGIPRNHRRPHVRNERRPQG